LIVSQVPAAARGVWHRRFELTYSHQMPVDPALLEILVCPECKAPVRLVHDGAGLKCDKCRRVYPIKDDIPVMLLDEATVEN
jgi:uncharacterized protein YbaR (Trm112 family)